MLAYSAARGSGQQSRADWWPCSWTRKHVSWAILMPPLLVDAIIAKRNVGTRLTDAPAVVALGPGFMAGRDCHAVVETMRGHTLGPRSVRGRGDTQHGDPWRDRREGRRARHPLSSRRGLPGSTVPSATRLPPATSVGHGGRRAGPSPDRRRATRSPALRPGRDTWIQDWGRGPTRRSRALLHHLGQSAGGGRRGAGGGRCASWRVSSRGAGSSLVAAGAPLRAQAGGAHPRDGHTRVGEYHHAGARTFQSRGPNPAPSGRSGMAG